MPLQENNGLIDLWSSWPLDDNPGAIFIGKKGSTVVGTYAIRGNMASK